MNLDAKAPSGPIEKKWDSHKFNMKLVNPNNKRKFDILVVGTGLAGASAAASLGELGYNVKVFCLQDTPRRAHSIAAQGGINAAKNYPNDGDSVWRLFYDTVKGGDYRAREANVYRLAQVSNAIIDQCVAQGVPFARDYGGSLDNRSFGGAQVSRTFFARGQTGQQLLLGAYSALMRQVGKGSVKMFTRREMVELVVVDDGSTDQSIPVIRDELRRFPGRRALLIEQENQGAHAAINRGLALTSGQILTILNSDDLYRPGRLSQMQAQLNGRDAILFSAVEFIDTRGEPLGNDTAHVQWYACSRAAVEEAPTLGFALLCNNLSVSSGNLVFSRGLCDRIGAFHNFALYHDWDFLMRATVQVEPELVPVPLYAYRVHNANSSHSLRSVQESEGRAALRRFLSLCETTPPPNRQAPCPTNWPRFFGVFARARFFHCGVRPIAHYAAEVS